MSLTYLPFFSTIETPCAAHVCAGRLEEEEGELDPRHELATARKELIAMVETTDLARFETQCAQGQASAGTPASTPREVCFVFSC